MILVDQEAYAALPILLYTIFDHSSRKGFEIIGPLILHMFTSVEGGACRVPGIFRQVFMLLYCVEAAVALLEQLQ